MPTYLVVDIVLIRTFATLLLFRYNLQSEVTLVDSIREGGFVNARTGELFARVPLNDQLNEDTDAGELRCQQAPVIQTTLLTWRLREGYRVW